MATTPPPRSAALAPDWYEKVLAAGATILFLLTLAALLRGHDRWDLMPMVVWLHLATVMVPLALTPVQLLRRHGDRMHRLLGWIWAVSLFATACISFLIRGMGAGTFSFIHIFSIVTVISVPLMVLFARRHNIARHRRIARALITGALLLAGFFTLIPGRLLGQWLWG